MSRLFIALLVFVSLNIGLTVPARAQGGDSPSLIVKKFYQQLHAKQYLEGFRLSVYSPAVESLTADEIQELEPDFVRIAESLPADVETSGEQISGDIATVFVKLPGAQQPQAITLTRIEGQWRIGDKETLSVVRKQGRAFFFNIRISISEQEAVEWLEEIYGSQTIYFQAKAKFTTLEELIHLGGVAKALTEGGYKYDLKVASDAQSYTVTATPLQYGRTGRRSFFIDQTGVIRTEEKEGRVANATSPKYMLNQ